MCAQSWRASRSSRSSRPWTSRIPMIRTSARRSPRCRPATSRSTPRSRRWWPRRLRSQCPTARDRPPKARRVSRTPGHVARQRRSVGLSRPRRPVGIQAGPAGSRRPPLPLRRRVLALGMEHPGGNRRRAPRAAPLSRRAAQHHDLQVQVADGTMITALEHPPPGLTIGDPAAKPKDAFLIWDVREPDRPQLLGQWVSGAAGTHRNFYNGGQWVYATSTLPGFEGQVLAIVDIADPANPKTAGIWWYPGQNTAAGETYTPEDKRRLTAGRPYPQHGLSLHGGAYALGDRAYCPWMRGGMVILDVADKHHPKHVSTLPVYPPLGSSIAVHSAVPLPDRDVVVINSEALREECDEPASYVATVDISDESDP